MSKIKTTDLIGTSEACELLAVDKSTLSRWVKFGTVTPAKRLSERGPMLFDRDVIERLAAERQSA